MSSEIIYTHTISESQRLEFKPTWLYIKYHAKTGLSYFGKTIKNPYKYRGSGTYWKNHIRKHDNKFTQTLWCHLFTDIDELVEYALWFSSVNDIVESELWANRVFEDGLGGRGVSGEGNGMYNKNHTEETKNLISEIKKINPVRMFGEDNPRFGKPGTFKNKTHTEESKIKISNSKKNKTYEEIYGSVENAQIMREKRSNELKNRIVTDLTRNKLSLALTGKPHTEQHRLNNSKAQKGLQAGANNPRALKIKAISPDGEISYIHGEFRKFCELNLLSQSVAGKMLKYNHKPKSGNCVGWSFSYE